MYSQKMAGKRCHTWRKISSMEVNKIFFFFSGGRTTRGWRRVCERGNGWARDPRLKNSCYLIVPSREIIVLPTQSAPSPNSLLNSGMQNNFHKLNQQSRTATASRDWNFSPLLTRNWSNDHNCQFKKLSTLWSLYIFFQIYRVLYRVNVCSSPPPWMNFSVQPRESLECWKNSRI